MKDEVRAKSESGFSLAELQISAVMLLLLVGAAVVLFDRGVNYYSGEQRTAQMNTEARNAVDIMALEIAQAGSRRDFQTTTPGAVAASASGQSVAVNSSPGFSPGDKVVVDTGANEESVVLTDVGSNTITGVFNKSHAAGTPIRLFALPYLTGIVPPAGMAANSSVTTPVLRFFGDFYDDGNLYYVEYALDTANSQITKSITPLTQASKNAAQPLIRNVTSTADPFTLYSDSQGAVTAVHVAMTVKNTWKKTDTVQETSIASRMAAPSVAAASRLTADNKTYGAAYKLPDTPPKVAAWSGS